MRRKGIIARFSAAILAALMLFAVMPAAPASALNMGSLNVSFADVSKSDWYYEYVSFCASLGIIEGKEDGLYHPDDQLKRGEFMKLLSYIGDLVPYTWDTSVHWAQPYWQLMNDNGVLWGIDDVVCTYSSLETPISRYEMSVMINNLCSNVYSETPVTLESPSSIIGDYDSMASKYHESVIQAFGKGILDGYEDGNFHGENTLTRAQAAAVVVRTAVSSERLEVKSATEVETPTGGDATMNPQDSFAWRSRSMIDAWGNPNSEARLLLFGDSSKTYFTGNESNLSDYIVTIQVRTWDINSSGQKYTRTWNLQVNKMVEDEVKAIFEYIYNDPEQFPIHALGCARFGANQLRHGWGCAIDINPVENFYCYTTTTPYTAVTGTTCYKYSDSPYCITPDSSVVEAFALYGWGWGGGTAENGYSGWNTTADYMHFSILASGG